MTLASDEVNATPVTKMHRCSTSKFLNSWVQASVNWHYSSLAVENKYLLSSVSLDIAIKHQNATIISTSS